VPFRTVSRPSGGGPREPRLRLHRVLAIAAGFAALTSAPPARAVPYNPDALPHAQTSLVDQLCTGVIGLQQIEERYVACVGSLSNSAGNAGPGAAALSPAAAVGPEPGLRKSYPYASNHELRHREQLSCDRLGLDPSGDAFAKCVADLDAALFNADNPMQ
jgi:hypothetical protein